jgi:hydroxypyruvate isomerase
MEVDIKKSICIETFFSELDFYDRFESVAKLGIEYVEFWTWPGKDIKRIKELLKKYSLKIASISGDFKYSPFVLEEREGYLKYLSESIEVARDLGCFTLVIHSNGMENGFVFNDGSKISTAKKYACMTRTYIEAASLAEKAGVTLVLEAISNFSIPNYLLTKTQDSGDIARVIGSPNFKILYDIWHMQQMEGNLVSNITEYIDVIGYLHIGDCPERHEPGTGEINFDRIKKTLVDLGYDGIYGLELVPSLPSSESAKWTW